MVKVRRKLDKKTKGAAARQNKFAKNEKND